MNSSQLNFFLGPRELESVYCFFKERKCNVLKRRVSSYSDRSEYDLSANLENLFQVYIYHPRDIDKINFILNEDGGYYYVDNQKSYCIEFGIGGFYHSNIMELQRSRLYYVTKFYNDNGEIIKKDSEFIKWASDILGSFKKSILISSSFYKGVFYSNEAKNWILENDAKLSLDGLKFVV